MLSGFSASTSHVAAIGAETTWRTFAFWFYIHLAMPIIGFLFGYGWFVVNFEIFFYLQKQKIQLHWHVKKK